MFCTPPSMIAPSKIDLVQVSELSTLRTLAEETFVDTFSEANTQENIAAYTSQAFSPEQMAAEYANADSNFYFIRVHSKIAGYIKLNVGAAQTEQDLPNGMEIERIYVCQTFQGTGLGRALMQKAIREARAAGVKWLWLGVWEDNSKAIDFYKKAGFLVFGRHEFFMGDERQFDIMMRLSPGSLKGVR